MNSPERPKVIIVQSFGDRVLKFVTFVNQLVWGIIGVAVLSVLIIFALVGPQKLLGGLVNNLLRSEAGLIPEGATPKEVIEKLDQPQQSCIEQKLGSDRYTQVLEGKVELSQAEGIDLAKTCLLK